jgi:hypothetical protein
MNIRGHNLTVLSHLIYITKKYKVVILKFVICALPRTQNCVLLGYYAGNSGNILRSE